MFIKLKTGAMLNLYWLQDCFQGKRNKNIVIFYMINGVKLIEEYDSEAEAEERVTDVNTVMESAGAGGSGSGGVTSHSALTGRNNPNQHTIAAIKDLQKILDSKAEIHLYEPGKDYKKDNLVYI